MPSATLRIIDANLNRAREAMRVLEDFARFASDDPAVSRSLKEMRHGLSAAARVWPVRDLLTARDTPGDVGTRITTAGERRRRSAADIVTAAAKRLTEALRVIEEYAKLDHPDAAAAVERIRYRAYDVEKRLLLPALGEDPAATARRARFAAVRLYVLLTESLCRRSWLRTARDVIAGGADCVQLREKDLDDAELLDRARRLAALCRRHGVLCIINDRPDIAVLAGADGVHLGQTDMGVADARTIVGRDLLIGRSTHGVRQFREALRERPDYVAIGPMYDTATKPQRHIAGPAILPRVLELAARTAPPWLQGRGRGRVAPGGDIPATQEGGRTRRLRGATAGPTCSAWPEIATAGPPVVAIGGITLERLAEVLAAGPVAVAVCAAVINAADPRAAARAFKRRIVACGGHGR